MNKQSKTLLANLPISSGLPRLSVGILKDLEHEALTELIARLALGGPFHLIAGSEWIADQDILRRSVRRYTAAVNQSLEHLIIGRPSTCLQVLDQLTSAESQSYPILILDFLHFFCDPDVELSLRQRVLEQCCQQVKHLSRSKSVSVLVQSLPIEEYWLFFPIIASVADEILEAKEEPIKQALQTSFFGDW